MCTDRSPLTDVERSASVINTVAALDVCPSLWLTGPHFGFPYIKRTEIHTGAFSISPKALRTKQKRKTHGNSLFNSQGRKDSCTQITLAGRFIEENLPISIRELFLLKTHTGIVTILISVHTSIYSRCILILSDTPASICLSAVHVGPSPNTSDRTTN